MEIHLQNTLTSKKEKFVPVTSGTVSMYNCGPTVYNYAHVGNLRSYVFADTLRRMFEYNGYNVKQIINVTDIGHLSSDSDDGEDKMTSALKREGKPLNLASMREIADFYFEAFKRDLAFLNIETPERFPFASEHIKEYVEMITTLSEKGITYSTSDGIYFDVSKFSGYGKLGNIRAQGDDSEHSRIGLNPEKKNSRDFAVWKFNHELGYDAPFGKGFPGWHIECSAMSVKYLGSEFDIHTGGIDHIPVHHNNEIAQAESAGHPYAHYWLHNAHYNIGEVKMAKSGDNFIKLETLIHKGIDPLALRYTFLGARYSSPLQYSEEALEGAQTAWKKLKAKIQEVNIENDTEDPEIVEDYKKTFSEYINDDLDTPKALALVWDILKDDRLSQEDKKNLVLDFDKVLGLRLDEKESFEIPEKVRELVKRRDEARAEKDFKKSDEIRKEIEELGFEVKDTSEGTIVSL